MLFINAEVILHNSKYKIYIILTLHKKYKILNTVTVTIGMNYVKTFALNLTMPVLVLIMINENLFKLLLKHLISSQSIK